MSVLTLLTKFGVNPLVILRVDFCFYSKFADSDDKGLTTSTIYEIPGFSNVVASAVHFLIFHSTARE